MRIIEANITSFFGQCSDAEHYYCYYKINDNKDNDRFKYCSVSQHDKELRKTLTVEERLILKNKDGFRSGPTTGRFNTIDEIHNLLKELFPNENIITYQEDRPFREMLCIIDGKDMGFEYIGEIWTTLPSSLYKDLIVGDYKIRCSECGEEFSLDQVLTTEREVDGRDWVKFIKRGSDLDIPCCKRPEIEWNLIY